MLRFHRLLLVLPLLFVTACGEDSTGPAPTPPPDSFEVSVKMSSINAIEDCESTPGNPGEFRYTLKITTVDEFGNRITIGTIGPDEMSIGDGSVLGSTLDPIRFSMPNEPGATFQVEYWVGEYDGASTSFLNHSWVNHTLDRSEEQMWQAGSDFDTYVDKYPEESYGIQKFTVWNTGSDCKGFANYIVRWKPMWD